MVKLRFGLNLFAVHEYYFSETTQQNVKNEKNSYDYDVPRHDAGGYGTGTD